MRPLTVLSLLLLAVSSTAGAADPSPTSPLATPSPTPASLYTQYCLGCHGEKGKGDGPMGMYLSPAPRDFTNPAVMGALTDETLRQTVSNGKGAMPAWKTTLSEAQIASLVAYVRTFTPPPTPPVSSP